MRIEVYRVTRDHYFGNPGPGSQWDAPDAQYIASGAIGVVVDGKIRFSHDDIRNPKSCPEYPAEQFLSASDVAFDKVAEMEIPGL
jgi:hypothetical protein